MSNPVPLDSVSVDCSDLASFLVDLPPRARLGMMCEHEGFSDVSSEIETNQAKFGEQAGITKADFDSFQEANQRIAMIDARLPALRKLLEVLEETRAKEDDRRQRLAGAFAESIGRRVKALGDATLLAKYETTRAYRSAISMKGVKTRAKKARAAEATEATEAADSPPAG